MLPRQFRATSAALGILLVLCPATDICAQASHCTETNNPPGDALLRLLLKNGQSIFHEGEIIALAAEYSANGGDKYIVSNQNYDRSGRLSGAEIFCIEPDHGTDPVVDYFHSLRAITGGGLSSDQDPATHPLTVDLELNEWMSLPPGSYSLTIIGNRLHLGQERDTTTCLPRLLFLTSWPACFTVSRPTISPSLPA